MSPVSPEPLLSIFLKHRSVCTDTRKIQSGDLYWALSGARFDGNQFAAQALEQGAVIAVVDKPEVIPTGDERYVLVEDCLKALQDLAHVFRKTWTFPVIGLTGSNGKTTTKELLASVLRTKFRVHATAGNFNNHIGVPLTILACPDEAEIAIIEMGTNQPGDIRELADMALPDYGLITNVGYAHLEKLISLDGVMVEKGQLFEVVKHLGGHLFVNQEDPRVIKAAGDYKHIHSFGHEQGEIRATIISQNEQGMIVEMKTEEDRFQFQSSMSGAHNALNMAAATSIGNHLGLTIEEITSGLSAYSPSNHRSQLIQREGYKLWMDAYNANPSSMAATIRHVMSLGADKVVLIVGDMYELGENSDELHAELGQTIEGYSPHLVIGVGEHIRHTLTQITTSTRHFPNTLEAASEVAGLVKDADLILLKASRGIGLEKLLEVI